MDQQTLSTLGLFQPDYLNRNQDEEEEQGSILPGLVAGGGALGAAAIGGEVARRKSAGGFQTFGDAAKDLAQDANTALKVLTGRSQYDENLLKSDEKNLRNIRQFGLDQPSNSYYFTEGKRIGDSSQNKVNTKQSYRKNPLTQGAIAMRDAFQASSEDLLAAERNYRSSRGETPEGPRSSVAFTRIPSFDAYKDLGSGTGLPFTNNADRQAFRAQEGIDLMKGNTIQRIGSGLGRTASDFVNNGARSLWWLINASQAVTDLASEETAGRANRFGLYGQDLLSFDDARRQGWIDPEGKPLNESINRVSDDTKDPYMKEKISKIRREAQAAGPANRPKKERYIQHNVYGKRRFGNNLSTLLALPGAIGINAGMNLLNPLGGNDGYKAVMPSEDDPTQTRNVIGEIAQKYFLGRSGDILPWEEFKKVRPDVSKSDYMAYKAYKYDKGIDLNPLDGDFNFGGILKGTNEGVNGAEVMFLGKSLDFNTTIVPTAFAIGGAALGSMTGRGGWLNQAGIEEGTERRDAVIKDIMGRANIQPADRFDQIPDADLKRLSSRERDTLKSSYAQNERSAARSKNVVEPITRRLGLKDTPEARSKAWSRSSPVRSGLAAGIASLVVGNLIGGEIERRRREAKFAENERVQGQNNLNLLSDQFAR